VPPDVGVNKKQPKGVKKPAGRKEKIPRSKLIGPTGTPGGGRLLDRENTRKGKEKKSLRANSPVRGPRGTQVGGAERVLCRSFWEKKT